MRKIDIVEGHTYSNGKMASAEVHRFVRRFSIGRTDLEYFISYSNCEPVECGPYVCRVDTFSRWAKVDVT